MRNRTLIGVSCIALAFAIFFIAVSLLKNSDGDTLAIAVAAVKIEGGQRISDGDIELIKVNKDERTSSVLSSASVVGCYALSDIYPGDYFTSEKISSNAGGTAYDLATLSDGQLAVTVNIADFAGGFSGQLENGDIVKIYLKSDESVTSPGALQYVRVITTVTSKGVTRDGVKAGEENDYDIPHTVMFSVNGEQAALLFGDGQIYCAFVCHGNDSRAEGYLAVQQAYFETTGSSAIDSTAAGE